MRGTRPTNLSFYRPSKNSSMVRQPSPLSSRSKISFGARSGPDSGAGTADIAEIHTHGHDTQALIFHTRTMTEDVHRGLYEVMLMSVAWLLSVLAFSCCPVTGSRVLFTDYGLCRGRRPCSSSAGRQASSCGPACPPRTWPGGVNYCFISLC